MQSLALVALVLLGQVAGDSRYGAYDSAAAGGSPQDVASPPETTSTTEPWDQPPVTPRDTATPPASQPLERSAPPASTSVTSPATAQQTVKPADLLESLSRPPISGRLGGEIVTLTEAIANCNSREEQTEVVSAYWDLSAALTDYYLSARESTELKTLLQSISQPSPAWQEARQLQTNRMQVARRTAELAQYRLHRLMKGSATDGMPLPADKPHAGAYETRYEQNFNGRETDRSRDLHELVPAMYAHLKLQAAQVTDDQSWLDLVSRQRNPQSDGKLLLKTHELVSLRRREFVRALRDYNQQIVRYTELASPGRVGTGRLVAMLIETPSVTPPGRDNSGVATTSGEEPLRSSNPLRTRPQTFSGEDRNVRREPTDDVKGERSILVKPQRR